MIFEKIRDMIAEQFSVEPTTVALDTTFEELGADSLDLMELIMALEEEFDLKVEDDEIEGLVSVGDIVEYIKDRT